MQFEFKHVVLITQTDPAIIRLTLRFSLIGSGKFDRASLRERSADHETLCDNDSTIIGGLLPRRRNNVEP